MDKIKKSLLLALCLGDGYISKDGCLLIEHSQKQESYIKWKQNLLNEICPTRYKRNELSYRERLDKRTNKIYKQVALHRQHKYFRILRKWLYTPTKIYKRKLLDRLTPEGVAIWYMDDGGLKTKISKKTGKVSSIQLSLYTYCSKEEVNIIRDYFFEVYEIEFKIYKRSDKYLLCANTQNGRKFINLVKPYIIPSMMYKVG